MDAKNGELNHNHSEAAKPVPGLAQLRETVLDCVGTALFVCDATKRGFPIVQISPAFTTITGHGPAEAMGGKLSQLHGSMTDAVTTKAVNDTLRRGQTFCGELLCYRADGSTVWCELILAPIKGETGSPEHFAGALTDISARKKRESQIHEQEAKYRGAFENAVEGVYQSTLEGSYIKVNQALAMMYGYRNPEALMEQVLDIQNQIYVDATMRERFKQLIEESDQVRGLEYQVRRREGQIIWISENARIVRDSNGKARYYEGFIEEITQRKEAEAALQQSQQRLVESSRQIAMVEITNGIVHNIGNALNSVNVSASMMSGKVANSVAGNLPRVVALLHQHEGNLAQFITSDPRGKHLPAYLDELAQCLSQEQTVLQEELKSLKKSVDHACDIIARQQDYAKSSGRLESVQAVELVEDALRMNATSLVRHSLAVVRDYTPNLPAATVQKHLVLQILVNLISNARQSCDASTSPAKCLTVRLGCDESNSRIRIEVQDTGVGIPPENLERIFKHGFTTRKDGHGFGLSSGVRMAREMGGSLTAHSAGVGTGATFILEFPCQPPA